jgi:hypothetical protein
MNAICPRRSPGTSRHGKRRPLMHSRDGYLAGLDNSPSCQRTLAFVLSGESPVGSREHPLCGLEGPPRLDDGQMLKKEQRCRNSDRSSSRPNVPRHRTQRCGARGMLPMLPARADARLTAAAGSKTGTAVPVRRRSARRPRCRRSRVNRYRREAGRLLAEGCRYALTRGEENYRHVGHGRRGDASRLREVPGAGVSGHQVQAREHLPRSVSVHSCRITRIPSKQAS